MAQRPAQDDSREIARPRKCRESNHRCGKHLIRTRNCTHFGDRCTPCSSCIARGRFVILLQFPPLARRTGVRLIRPHFAQSKEHAWLGEQCSFATAVGKRSARTRARPRASRSPMRAVARRSPTSAIPAPATCPVGAAARRAAGRSRLPRSDERRLEPGAPPCGRAPEPRCRLRRVTRAASSAEAERQPSCGGTVPAQNYDDSMAEPFGRAALSWRQCRRRARSRREPQRSDARGRLRSRRRGPIHVPLSLVVGPAHAGKVALLLERYLARLDDEPFLIVPEPLGRRPDRARPARALRLPLRRHDRHLRRPLRPAHPAASRGDGPSRPRRSGR